jgi:hypothetical protein
MTSLLGGALALVNRLTPELDALANHGGAWRRESVPGPRRSKVKHGFGRRAPEAPSPTGHMKGASAQLSRASTTATATRGVRSRTC